MKILLFMAALVIGFTAFSMMNVQEASAMNKAELVDAIAGDANLSKADAKRALEALTDATATALKKGNNVQLIGFGSFSISKRAARKLAKQDNLLARERACLWLAGRAPGWLHGVFCTVSDTEIVALMARSDDPTSPPLGVDELQLFLQSFKSITTDQLVIRDVVDIEDFGAFRVKEGKGRKGNRVKFMAAESFVSRIGRNPQTGKEIKIAAKNVVKFKAGADLSKKVN